jgi:hypothetical protein
MSHPPHPPIPLPLRALRISLVLGAAVDIAGGVALLARPEQTARWIGVPVEGLQIFWPTYAAVFLFVLPMVYLVTALNPAQSLANVAVAIAGRFLGGVAYGLWYLPLGKPSALLGMIVLNFGFAYYYFHVLRPGGRAQMYAALRVSNLP